MTFRSGPDHLHIDRSCSGEHTKKLLDPETRLTHKPKRLPYTGDVWLYRDRSALCLPYACLLAKTAECTPEHRHCNVRDPETTGSTPYLFDQATAFSLREFRLQRALTYLRSSTDKCPYSDD